MTNTNVHSLETRDSYDEIADDQNLSTPEKEQKKYYFDSIFIEVGEHKTVLTHI